MRVLAIAVFAAVALTGNALVADSLRAAARRQTIDEAQLVTALGVATAASDGRLTDDDVRAARAEAAVARDALGMRRLVVWNEAGEVEFTDPTATDPIPVMPTPAVRDALTDGPASEPVYLGSAAGPVVVVPVRAGDQNLAVELQFAPVPVQGTIDGLRRATTALIIVGAVLLYTAALPILSRLARRLPTPEDLQRQRDARDVDRAIDRGELQMWFQPQLSIVDHTVVGVEALLRWQHPSHGIIAPAPVLGAAESSEAVLARLDAFVLQTAIGTMRRLHDRGIAIGVALNISAASLLRPGLPDEIREALSAVDAEPGLLTVEITETALVAASDDAKETLRRLRTLGVSIAIDDFGTGHSSLWRLVELPFDELKIDRSFVRAMATDPRAITVTRLIIDLARQLDLRTVAEGVETAADLEQLAALGVDAAQGFLLAQPMPEPVLVEWLAQHALATRRAERDSGAAD